MKKIKHISPKWRKLTAVLLLLTFLGAPLINAFPQEECNGVCEITSIIHECDSETNEMMKMTCCDMMEMNSSKTSSNSLESGMEFSDINCALILQQQINYVYLLPKTIDSDIEFIRITILDLVEDNSDLKLFALLEDNTFRNKSPIYLTNLVFLI